MIIIRKIIFTLFLINCKNIILPIKRVSFEKFTGKKTIDDYISYSMYTELYVGTPPQKVTHFIEPNDSIFQFRKVPLQYNSNKFNNSVYIIEKEEFSLFYTENSSSYTGYYSDIFIFNDNYNKTIEVPGLKFTIYYNNREDKENYGIIGLFTMIDPSPLFEDLYSFINQLKAKEIIDDYVFYFIYNNSDKDYLGDSKDLGIIHVGEYPHISDEKIYNKNDLIKIYSASSSHWSLMIDEIKFIYNDTEQHYENHMECNFDFSSKFIKGTHKYEEFIEKVYFEQLINDNLCEKELISENKNLNNYNIYSCNNTNIIKEKLKNFPILNFTIKNDNLFFGITYNDLFKSFGDRLYFMIIFPNNKYREESIQWSIGEIFLKKFIPTFNIDAKSISFYKNQINKANNYINKINDNENNENKNGNNIIRILIEVFMGIIIIICIYLIIKKYIKERKKRANELEDNDYEYIPNDAKKESKIINEKEIN